MAMSSNFPVLVWSVKHPVVSVCFSLMRSLALSLVCAVLGYWPSWCLVLLTVLVFCCRENSDSQKASRNNIQMLPVCFPYTFFSLIWICTFKKVTYICVHFDPPNFFNPNLTCACFILGGNRLFHYKHCSGRGLVVARDVKGEELLLWYERMSAAIKVCLSWQVHIFLRYKHWQTRRVWFSSFVEKQLHAVYVRVDEMDIIWHPLNRTHWSFPLLLVRACIYVYCCCWMHFW